MAGVGSNMQQYLQGIQGLGRKLNTPTANMLGGAALGAGLSVAGNAMNGELDDKGAGRVALEALGAGALGATAGKFIGGMNRDAVVKKYMPEYQDTVQNHANMGMYLNGIGGTIGQSAALLGGMSAAAGLGSLLGGGISDLTQAAGVPGFGSSNTASAKSGMGAATTAQPLYTDQMSGDPNEQYLAYLEANQIPYA